MITLINGIKAWGRGLLSGKLDKPAGGKDGDILTKAGNAASWQPVDIVGAVQAGFPGGVGYSLQKAVSIVYSGNPADYEIVELTLGSDTIRLARIDDGIYKPEDFVGGSLAAVVSGNSVSISPITADDVQTIVDDVYTIKGANIVIIVSAPGASISGNIISTPGLYIIVDDIDVVTSLYVKNTIIYNAKINDEYLPTNLLKKYYFSGERAPADAMRIAVEEFAAGQALILWDEALVIHAELMVDTLPADIRLTFGFAPSVDVVFSEVDGYFDISSGTEFPNSAGLPQVTAADNGKILAVVNGKWAAVSQEG